MSAVATIIDPKEYSKLLKKALPQVIRTEEQNEAYIAELEELTASDNLTPEEQELVDLLAVLIEKFEDEHYELTSASPVEVLALLMESHGLKQKDLVDVFGTASVVSEVLHGKRRITINQIKKLSNRFSVPPQVFF